METNHWLPYIIVLEELGPNDFFLIGPRNAAGWINGQIVATERE